jgi:hypothetical protein
MQDLKIFTESKADIKFLQDYIDDILKISLRDNFFEPLGSWSGYKTKDNPIASIKQNATNKAATVLILDADTNFDQRKSEVLSDFKRFEIPVQLFLFPTNSEPGSLETILENIAVERKIIDCFHAYETCIRGYETPVIKSKIFAYLDALLPEKNKKGNSEDQIQEKNRNYKNTSHWDLQSKYLSPLKEFLSPLFK